MTPGYEDEEPRITKSTSTYWRCQHLTVKGERDMGIPCQTCFNWLYTHAEWVCAVEVSNG